MSTQLPDPPTLAYEPEESWEERLTGWPVAVAWVVMLAGSWAIAIAVIWFAVRFVGFALSLIR